ncbi:MULTISPECIES: hypothetical protein [unclassified Bacillus (in: firmicutes)]|uniref:hypothetical protein n=1 Tax=unclassified Bacillus (in: firmicutes) TaxID=185979 RepID=UPI0008E7FA7D|nr:MULTISPECIES: hypothetical protein [unclassified Bacillus (in: firmicutes)]SFA99673.1 hypothetical protein SAMN02799634_103460 [Bacillus sp. UNCCL13]SFQ81746.1 hypothetical protein SAMN04488577_2091 [Bacillus sp. cl95]
MYEFKDEFERKEKKFKIYIFLFVISVLIHTFIDVFDLGIEKVSGVGLVISLLFFCVILYFGLRRKLWAEVMIKFFVWLNIILLFLIITVKILGL